MKESTRIDLTNRTKLEQVIPLDTPFVLYVDPSSFCNLKCFYCYHSKPQKKVKFGLMDIDTFNKILSQCIEFPSNFKILRLYGFGEPLLNLNFSKFVQLAKKTNKFEKIDVTTNGLFLSRELIDKLVEYGLDRINISVIGLSSEDYERITQKRIVFNSLVKNLEYFYNKKDRKCKIFVKINSDLLKNKEDLKTFKEIFAPISDKLGVEHLMACWDEVPNFQPNTQIGLYGQPVHSVNVCPYIFYSLMIQYDGVVSACFLDWNRKLVLGNIENDTLKNIWNGYKLFEIQKTMLEHKRHTINPCNKCSQLKYAMCDDIDGYSSFLLEKIKKL